MGNEIILVTGAGGLVGHALVEELVRQGRYVVGFDLRDMAAENDYYKPVVGDLTDIHRIYNIFNHEKISAVIHCGAISGPMLSLDNPYAIIQVNVMGTANLLEASRIFGIDRYVYCSSGSAYGLTYPQFTHEALPLFPLEVYGATKACGEHLVQAYSVQHGLDGVSVRICTVYGVRRKTSCIVRQMISDALENRSTILDWGQTSYREFIYVKDVASALIAALDKRHLPNTVYNAASKSSYVTIGELAKIVREVMPGARIEVGPNPEPSYIPRGKFDVSTIKRDMHFSPAYDLYDGIRDYLQQLKTQV